jgi:type I restriction enzyme, S subunit
MPWERDTDGLGVGYADASRMRQGNAKRLAPGDLLVNRVNSRELVGKSAVFPKGLEPCVYESKNIRVRLLSELVNPDFVNYQLLLLGQTYFNYNSQQVVGMASISQPQIGEFPLLLPPRVEQDRIVSVVQAMLVKVEDGASRLDVVAKLIRRFRQAVLAAAFSGRLTEDWRREHKCIESAADLLQIIKMDAKSDRVTKQSTAASQLDADPFELPPTWTWAGVNEVCSTITDGDHQPPPKAPRGIPFLVISNINKGKVNTETQCLFPPSTMTVSPMIASRAGAIFCIP